MLELGVLLVMLLALGCEPLIDGQWCGECRRGCAIRAHAEGGGCSSGLAVCSASHSWLKRRRQAQLPWCGMNSWTGLGAKPGYGGDGQAVKLNGLDARAVEAVTKKAIEAQREVQNGETLQAAATTKSDL